MEFSMELLTYLRQFHNLSDDDFRTFSSGFKTKRFKKGEWIISPGQIQKELYFVKEGVQMSYFESEHKTQVIAFTYAPNLCAIPESFSFQVASKHFIKCMSDSEFDYVTFDDLQVLFSKSQQVERLFRKLAEAILGGVINRHIELNTLTIEERFRTFCQRSPQLLQLIPHKYLASYLGIDATNFSKLYNSVKI
jgi:CRP-like cAMP-binding protein